MTPYPPPSTRTAAVVKNILGALLLLIGLVGVVGTAWATHPLLGLGVTSAALAAVGYWLATSEA